MVKPLNCILYLARNNLSAVDKKQYIRKFFHTCYLSKPSEYDLTAFSVTNTVTNCYAIYFFQQPYLNSFHCKRRSVDSKKESNPILTPNKNL